MIGDPYEEIKMAEKAITKKEQEDHLKDLDESLCTLLKTHGKANLPSIDGLISQLHTIQAELGKGQSPITLASSFVADIKALSDIPLVKGSVDKTGKKPQFCRTLFDYVQ
ncbi:hypothetical protein NECID01_0364 [Nematocida sp. AWRm77]|nr:hypothetical protein NECID01_0364 [Nematocida sp. AWRm77]